MFVDHHDLPHYYYYYLQCLYPFLCLCLRVADSRLAERVLVCLFEFVVVVVFDVVVIFISGERERQEMCEKKFKPVGM